MVNTTEEILLTIGGRDDASQTFANIDRNAQSMASNISSAMSSINSAFMNFGQVSDNLMQSLTGKSALDNIFATSSKAETNNVLLSNMLDDSEKNFDSFYETVDKTTDNSIVSMQELIPALNAFKSATGATDDELRNVTPSMANFGAAVLAQTGSVDRAQQAMMDLSKGYKGAYASLDQYGISKDALVRTGYWSGEEEDVEGYMKAVTEVIGSTDALMETNQGLDALIGKSFSRAGKKIGNEFLPILKDMKRGFIDLDDKMGGAIASTILIGSASIESGNRIMWNISTAAQGFRDLKEAAVLVKDAIKGIGDATEETGDLLNTMSNASDISAGAASLEEAANIGAAGAGAAGVGGAATLADDAGDVGKKASKAEKVVEGGTDALFAADTLSNLKSGNKYDLDAIKEATKSVQSKERLSNELDNALDAEGKVHDLLNKQSKVQSNIDSGVFGKEMVSKFKNQVKQYDKEIDDIIGSDFWTGTKIKSKSKPKNYFKELLSDDSLKDGKKSLADIMASRKDNFSAFDDFIKDNDNARKKAGDTLKSLGSHEFIDDDILKEWEKSEWGVTDAIKNKASNFKSRITSAFSSIKDFNFKQVITSPFRKLTSGLSSIKDFSLTDTLQSGIEKGFSGIGGIASSIKSKFTSFGNTLSGLKNIDISSKLKGLDQKLFRGLDNFSFKDSLGGLKDKLSGLRKTADVLDEAGDVGKTLEGAGDIAKGMEAAGAAGEAASVAGPAMETGAAGAEAASVGATGLSAAFTSMIVPLLALAATIIIMIPIVAVIAAEAMVFLKLLADFMASLHFENIDLKGAVKGISQVAIALAWVGVAMASMTFAGIMTGLAVITSGFGNILGPLDIAINALKDAAKKLEEFSNVRIDPSVATNLQTIGSSLLAVSTAMGALTWNNIVTGFSNWIAGALGFSSVTEGLEQAKNDLIEASTKLNEFSGLTPLDESIATNIQNVCNSLASVGDAMGALRSIRDGQNWDEIIGGLLSGIFGEGVDIQTALTNVKEDIVNASTALAEFTNLTEIPEDVATKITSISNTLKSVSDAFNTLRKMRDDSNWDDWINGLFGGMDIASALEQIKTDLLTVSQKLSQLSSLSEISEDVTNKLNLIGTTLTKVSEVCTTLSNLPEMGEFDPAQITTAVNNVITTATQLARLNEVAFDSETADGLLSSIQTTLENIKNTLAADTGFSEPATNIGSQIISGTQSGLSPLPSTIQGAVSAALSSAAPQATSGGNTIGANATSGMKSSLNLKSTMETEVGYALTAMTSKEQEFYNAGAALGTAAKNGFESTNAINPGSPGNLAHVMMDEVGYILESMKSKYRTAYDMAAGLGNSIYKGFGNPALDVDMFTNGGQLTAEHIGALKTTISNAPDKTDNRPVTIIVQEGAIGIDARNYTTKDAQRLMITAFEGMDHISNITVDGD